VLTSGVFFVAKSFFFACHLNDETRTLSSWNPLMVAKTQGLSEMR
jgi:hypothetical protein